MKPIFVVRFPETTEKKHLQEARESLRKMGIYQDYHCLIIKDQFTGGEIKFECYNAPHTKIKFKELEEKIIKLLKNKENE